MSDFKGTPGPWFAKPVSDCVVEGSLTVIRTTEDGPGFHIAYASSWMESQQTKEEADANANIIASAPKMLDALMRCEAALSSMPLTVEYVNDLLNAREVIKQALGQ